ncbi:MAG: ParB/RepB/Spo0J family partition protein, partial [Myxococcota bacterium]
MSEPKAARGLGRGLAALLSTDTREAAPGAPPADTLVHLAIDALRPNPEQPRETFAPAALDSLAASIREHGILTPLVARREGDGYVLIAGERRWRAARMAGLERVPVFVRGAAPTLVEQLELALIENLQREDLDPVEAALGYQRLVQQYGHTQEQVAQRVGKDRATVANALRLLKLPPAGLEALKQGRISAGHARALLPVEDSEQFAVALATVITRELSVRATEQMVRGLKKPAAPAKKPDRGLTRLADSLTRSLGSRVSLKPKAKGGGRIVIDYTDAAELD